MSARSFVNVSSRSNEPCLTTVSDHATLHACCGVYADMLSNQLRMHNEKEMRWNFFTRDLCILKTLACHAQRDRCLSSCPLEAAGANAVSEGELKYVGCSFVTMLIT